MGVKIEFKGKYYNCEWKDAIDSGEIKKVTHAHGFVFDKGKFCMVKVNEEQGWSIPGGHVEKGETPEEAFIREINEEADLEMKDITRIGYLKISPIDNPTEVFYQARFIARVKKILPQTIDPDEGTIPERIFINPEEFGRYTSWKELVDFQMEKALEALKKMK